MTKATPAPSRWRSLARQWGPFLVLAVVLLLLTGLDRQFKQTDLRGYALADADWQLESDDLPHSWTAWEESAEYALLQESAPPFMSDVAVAVRKATGVRPTPSRLRFWLGRAGVVSGNGSGWALSCRPGVAMRFASFFHRWVAESPSDSIYVWGAMAYAWHDGYLLVGSSPSVLQELAQTGSPVEHGGDDGEGISLAWEGPHAGRLSVAAREGLPFRVAMREPAAEPTATLHYSASWPDAMMLLNYADDTSVAPLRGVGRALVSWAVPEMLDADGESYMQAWWAAQLPPLPPLECAGERLWVAFPAEDPQEKLGVGVGHVATDCGSALTATMAALDVARDYQWEDQPGWLLTSPHHVRARAVTVREDDLLWTNEPSRMLTLLNDTHREELAGQLYVRAQWAPTMRIARAWLLELAEQELLPGYHTDDLTRDWLPYMDALAAWPRLEATGRTVEGHFLLEGYLARPDHG